MPLSEGSVVYANILTWGLPFIAFYGAMTLRHFAFRSANSLTFLQRVSVSLPASFILIAAFNALLGEIGHPSYPSVFFVTGFVMEQALLIELGLSAWLKYSAHAHPQGLAAWAENAKPKGPSARAAGDIVTPAFSRTREGPEGGADRGAQERPG
jgi:hypothetical protein